MQKNGTLNRIKRFFHHWATMMNPPVFIGAAGIVLLFIIYGGVFTDSARKTFDQVLHFISGTFGWYYVLAATAFFIFVIWLYISPYSKIKLGQKDDRPEFSKGAWLTMLFSAGMGMGLVFWGIAEPMSHYMNPPFAEGETKDAIYEGMQYSFFHWGFHPWAVYVIFAMGIAYFHFRLNMPLAPRSLLYPLIGEKIHGWMGHLADIICTVGTLLGVATSLGLGAMQINSGLSELTDISYSANQQVIIIAIITAVATFSTITGVHKGIKYLSFTNMLIMLALMIFVFISGPTLYQLGLFITSLGNYLGHLPEMSLWLGTGEQKSWQMNWTLFYWGWWISWCPFVGIFVARISRGRTIREFITYVFFIPPLVTFLWFAIFGGTALHIDFFEGGNIAKVVDDNVAMSLHELLGYLPFASITRWVSVALIIIFFITSSDSGSLVDDMVTSGGHPNPPAAQRAFWGISEGAAAAVLLLAGGLNALQSAAISGGLLQSLLVVVTCASLVKYLKKDLKGELKAFDDDYFKSNK